MKSAPGEARHTDEDYRRIEDMKFRDIFNIFTAKFWMDGYAAYGRAMGMDNPTLRPEQYGELRGTPESQPEKKTPPPAPPPPGA
jgi:hypothetical protein